MPSALEGRLADEKIAQAIDLLLHLIEYAGGRHVIDLGSIDLSVSSIQGSAWPVASAQPSARRSASGPSRIAGSRLVASSRARSHAAPGDGEAVRRARR